MGTLPTLPTLPMATVSCPGCGSNAVLHRGGNDRQCSLCRFRFSVTASGGTTSVFHQWLAAGDGMDGDDGRGGRHPWRTQRINHGIPEINREQ